MKMIPPASENNRGGSLTTLGPRFVDCQTQTSIGEESPGIFDYAAILLKFRWTLLLALAVGIASALVYSFQQKPSYRARLQLEVQELNQNFLNVRDLDPTAAQNTGAPDAYVELQSQVLRSEPLLNRVVNRLRLDERKAYVAQSVTPVQRIAQKLGLERLLAALPAPDHVVVVRRALGLPAPESDTPRERALRVAASNLKVKTAAQSSLVELFYTAPDRETPAEFLNTLAEEYIAYTMEARWAGTERTAEWLNTRLRDMRTHLEASERKLEAYARDSGMLYGTGANRESVGEERLRQLQKEWSNAQAERASLQAKFELIDRSLPEKLPEVLDHSVLRDLATQLAQLRREYSQLTAVMTPEHQKVRSVQSQIDAVNGLIRAEVENVLGRIRNEYEAVLRREALLADSYQKQFLAVAEQAGRSVPYHILKREVESQRQFYQDMLQKVNSAGVATAIRASNIRVLNPARQPDLPFRPDLALNLLIGGGGSLLIGMALSFVREAADRRSRKLRRPGDAARYLDIPEFGFIPSLTPVLDSRRRWVTAPSRRLLGGATQPAIWRQRTFMLNDSFQAALDSLLQSAQGVPPEVVGVVSALPLEGKTTITGYLGLALAEISKRVLLIDADTRKPALHKQFAASNAKGLSDLLRSEQVAQDDILGAIVKSDVPGLDLLPAGPSTDDVARAMALGRFENVVAKLRPLYDTILVDTPPLLLFSESRVLGRQCDGVVMVVRSNRNPLEVYQHAAEMLRRSGANVLGTILNDCKVTGDYYASAYYKAYGRS